MAGSAWGCQYGPTVWLEVGGRITFLRLRLRRIERRGVEAAQHDVEAKAEGPLRLGQLDVERGEQPGARLRVGDRLVDRVDREQRIAGEVHLGDQPRSPRRAEQREVDVVGTPGVVVIAPRVCARLDRHEAVAAVAIGEHPAEAVEVRIERRVVLIAFVVVAPAGVGLPQLEHRVGDRAIGLVGDLAGDDDPLALRLAGGVARHVDRARVRARREHRAGALDRRLDRDQRLARRALAGAAVGRDVVRRLAAGRKREVGGHGDSWATCLAIRIAELAAGTPA
jgi:hypothetical protein